MRAFQIDTEGRPGPHRAVHFDPATVPLDDLLDDHQAQARAAGIDRARIG